MKRKEIKELHDKGIAELRTLLRKIEAEFSKARLEISAGKLKDQKILSKKKDDIARIKTIMKENLSKEVSK